MGYNVAGLPAYTSQQSKVFITKTILGAATIALLTQYGAFDPTAKGSEAIQLMDTDIVIQDDTGCGRNPLGGATLTQAVLTVKQMKINQNYCTKVLVTTWAVEELKSQMAGLPYTDAMFLDTIGNMNTLQAALKLEQMIWQGDTTLADISLQQINGFIKQLTTIGVYDVDNNPLGYIDLNPGNKIGDNTINSRLRAIDAAMPIAVTSQPDYMVLIGQDYEKRYIAELADKNLYKDPLAQNNFIWGTKTKYMAIPGLNGTNIIWAGKVGHLRAGGEMTAAQFKKYYSPETEQTYFDSHFSLGVVPVLTFQMGMGKYTLPN